MEWHAGGDYMYMYICICICMKYTHIINLYSIYNIYKCIFDMIFNHGSPNNYCSQIIITAFLGRIDV